MSSKEAVPGTEFVAVLRTLGGQQVIPKLDSDGAVRREARSIADHLPAHVSPELRRLAGRVALHYLRQERKAQKQR